MISLVITRHITHHHSSYHSASAATCILSLSLYTLEEWCVRERVRERASETARQRVTK